jgi:hypothetical protein
MAGNQIKRRDFVTGGALAAGALAGGLAEAQTRVPSKAGAPSQTKAPSTRSILNYNQNMEYRKLGRTGLMVSAISLGGHWKRIEIELGKDKVPAREERVGGRHQRPVERGVDGFQGYPAVHLHLRAGWSEPDRNPR